jgi:hypothetical protein
MRTLQGEPRGQLSTTQPRHHHVGNQQVYGVWVPPCDRQGFISVTSGEDRVALVREHIACEPANRAIVLREEERWSSRRSASMKSRLSKRIGFPLQDCCRWNEGRTEKYALQTDGEQIRWFPVADIDIKIEAGWAQKWAQ